MTPQRQQLVRDSWRHIEPIAIPSAQFFYDKLFELDPTARPLFARTDMAAQHQKVMDMLTQIVQAIDDPERFVTELAELGRRHAGYGAREADYASVGAALLWTLERGLGDGFTPEVRDAWAEAYRMMAGIMRRAARS